ncbi:copper amine oxidase N-terminal domain-containing protein [Brevibacillus panacihumi]|uniref:Copper amine oxidase N-terminal domain-containing protein n=1 Tax=Brevibacillus panacihumi TaxID=497735 RepID=A0A3M8DEF9_9BACL|nr:copper amine oxidase N-terminal domain-containing protein [Brevibacillus panacihumi]
MNEPSNGRNFLNRRTGCSRLLNELYEGNGVKRVMMKKKATALILGLSLVPMAASFSMSASAASAIQVEYNQTKIVFPDQKPILQKNRTLVPIRPIAESLGFEVDWNEANRTVIIKKGSDQVRLVVSQKLARKNGETIQLDVPTQIVNRRTMVPLRFIAEALQYDVNWDQEAQTVLIADASSAATPPENMAATAQTTQPEQPGAAIEQPKEEVMFIDPEEITANSANLMGLGIYIIKGKAEPGLEMSVQLADKTYDVKVASDGTYKFELMDKIFADEYTLTVSNGDQEQIIEGEFTKRN